MPELQRPILQHRSQISDSLSQTPAKAARQWDIGTSYQFSLMPKNTECDRSKGSATNLSMTCDSVNVSALLYHYATMPPQLCELRGICQLVLGNLDTPGIYCISVSVKTVLLCVYHCPHLLFIFLFFFYCSYVLNKLDNNLSHPPEVIEHLPERIN